MVHLYDEISKVILVLNLWIFEKSFVESSYEDQDLTPMNVRGIPDLLHASLSLLVLKLLRYVKVLLIQALHNVCLEEALQNLNLAHVDGAFFRHCVVD